ncbi:chromatin assembly factor 1 subunit A-like isoform X2 [Maniola jurtina]|uniref:chromatin assembly factor 1 subunit A-like isoform X2 n=1 Tax=Maniola jurtina TaxID=191418 RepID=UPI001E68E852|nr:chromatin assembly factor 1 subunit A-like isoform X2 [Maniola jurtina]
MKTPKSSDSEEVTPSKKVLKQARLPFKTLSEVSPKPITPPSRKRKLSAPEPEPDTKVGKIPKQNSQEDPILVISDDDSNTATEVKKVPVHLNPMVKLVDTAWKKKLQKSKGAKKRKGGAKSSKTVTVQNGSVKNDENCDGNESDKVECLEEMDIDEADDTDKDVTKKEDTKKEAIEKLTNVTENNIIDIDNNSNSIDNVTKSDETKPNVPSEESDGSTDSNSDVNKSHKHSPKKQNAERDQEDIDLKEIEEQDTSAKSPKRSVRIKTKIEDNKNLDTSVVSNCDESLSSDPSTPRRSNRKGSLTNSQGDVSMNSSTNTNSTPKRVQKKLESAKKKEEREKERLEREKKKQLEKEEREKQKREKDEQKKREKEEKEEAKKKEREEKEEQRRKEKEEKEKQKELEKKIREEKEEQKRKEKEEKEEQRRKEKEAREDEKKKKQEALEQEKLEQEQKKKKAAEAFVSFFVPKQKAEKESVTTNCVSKNNMLSSFTIKSDMRLAPTTRVSLNDDSKKTLDNLLLEQNVSETSLYIKSLKDGSRKPLTDGKTWPLTDKDDDDVMIVEDELPPPVDSVSQIITCDSAPHEKLRPKLLAFHDNRRPPYWGTWRKKSSFIKPRQPFKTDELLDYEVDSDEEWEEEQDGESLDGSAAGSEDEQDADEYEVDNEVFVPHGYLSDEEATLDEDDVQSLSPETQKARLKHLEDEFENEMKKPTEKLKPWFYGLSWETEDGGKPEKCADAIWDYFGKFSMIMNDPTPLLQPANESVEPEKKKVKKKKIDGEQQSPKTEKKKKSKPTDDKDGKKSKIDNKKANQEVLKNQPGINTFLKKLKTS